MTNQYTGGRWPPIRPHKGGRSERTCIRQTSADKDALPAIKEATGKTAADLMAEIIAKYRNELGI